MNSRVHSRFWELYRKLPIEIQAKAKRKLQAISTKSKPSRAFDLSRFREGLISGLFESA